MDGGQWQALYLLERLEQATLLARAGSPLFEEAKRRGVDVRPLSLAQVGTLARQADLIHAHDAKTHSMAAAVAGGTPLVVSRRVAFPIQSGWLSRWKYARAMKFLAVSRFVADRLEDADIPHEKICVVHDGVPIPETPSVPEPKRVVALRAKPCTIPGVDIELTDHLWESLQHAAVFVYRSELEGLGSAALAAMAMGIPVVASRAGGLAETVVDGETGFLVDDDDFREPVLTLLDSPALARRMGAAGRQRAQREFSVDLMVARTRKAYLTVLRPVEARV